MNRPDISRLNKNRSIYLKLGFIISLSLTVMAFNYTSYDTLAEAYHAPPIEDDILVDVRRTVHPERKLPPPSFKPSDKIEDVEVEFVEVPEPEPLPPEVIPFPSVDPDPDDYMTNDPPPLPAEKPKEILEVDSNDGAGDIMNFAEQMPRFNGCEDKGLDDKALKACVDKALLDYIYSNIKYPSIARENGIEGVVVASFVIEKDGSITVPKVLRDIGGGCGKEVIRIVNKMPKWVPGKQGGRKVRVQFNLPVKFTLQ